MDSILVSIITPTYNSEKTLSQTIESVLFQTYNNIEYIIVDGLSSDRTVEIAKSYSEAFKLRNIRYTIVSEKDRGMYDALNKGIKLSSGVIVGSINSDDWYELDTVEKVVKKYLETHFDMLYGDMNVIMPSGNMIKKGRLRKYHSSRDWNHPTTFITRCTYEQFQYKLESLYDDFDLYTRIKQAGLKIVVLNEVLANFRFGGMSTQKSIRDVITRIKARYRLYRNNGYSRLYLIECVLMELVKYILS